MTFHGRLEAHRRIFLPISWLRSSGIAAGFDYSSLDFGSISVARTALRDSAFDRFAGSAGHPSGRFGGGASLGDTTNR